VFKSTDGGDHWAPANAGLPDLPMLDILALAADPRDPAVVYVGTATHGIFKSRDGGNTWRPSSTGLFATP
jgi:photosystem II stability/assembly factor-like uncharacterized protein